MAPTAPRHFLDLDGIDAATLRRIVDMGHAMKRAGKRVPDELKPAGIADAVLMLIFEKPSTRTRVSFDVAMRQLGGQTLALNHTDLQIGRGEPISDTAKVLSRYVDAIMIRANRHETLGELAEHATVPVINGLTDRTHPCQIVADLLTLMESGRTLRGLRVAWLGDGNNVLASIMEAGALMDFDVVAACPQGFQPSDADVARGKGRARVVGDPREAVERADVVVTDTWISMGQAHADTKLAAMMPYQVTGALMAHAKPGAAFLHCLPAHRGEEVTDEVIDGPQSLIWPEAENRLHAQKSILRWCFGQIG